MGLALRFSAASFAYRQAPVFRSLDLSVAEGEMTAVLGPNGTGKTTLLRLASGSLKPASGRVELFARDLLTLPSRERARIVAVVPQETHLVFDFTVKEVVLMGRAPHLGLLGIESQGDLEIARDAMARTEVAHLAHRRFLSLSGGERQGAVIARALAQEPRLLLLDEPTAFLDLRHRLAVYDLLERLNRDSGLTLVVASHDLNMAARHCGRLVLLHQGAVVADGSPEDVLRPEHIRSVYGVEAEIRQDPITGRPYVIPLAPVGS